MTTFIYLIGDSGDKQKIGISKNPEKRLKALQTGNSDSLEIHYKFELEDKYAFAYEKYIHRELNHKRIKNEWFNIEKDEAKKLMVYYGIMYDTLKYQLI